MAKKAETEAHLPLVTLSDKAFDAYCTNLSGLFNIDILYKRHETATKNLKQLKDQFKKLLAVHSFKSEGELDGDFYIIFDTETLFALAGIVMQLSEEQIREKTNNGTSKEADEIYDAVAEAANLLIASWDNIFNEELDNHGGLTRTDTVITKNIAKSLNKKKDQQFLLITYHLIIKDWPEFKCFVIFTNSFLENTASMELITQPAESEQQQPEQQPEPDEQPKDETEDGNQEPQDTEEQPEPPVEGEVSKAIKEMVNTADKENDIPPEALIDISKSMPSTNLTAKDIMQTDILWAEPDESVQQIQSKMQQHDITYILVGKDRVLEGIVSMSDVRDAISPYLKSTFSKWRRPLDDASLQIRSKWIMTRAIHTIKPETPLTEILIQMCNHNIRSLPVINNDNQVEGLITVFDIFKAMIKSSNLELAGKAVQTSNQN